MSSWVLRTAAHSRICSNCDDHIRPGTRYWLMSTGEKFCQDCPPDDYEESCPL